MTEQAAEQAAEKPKWYWSEDEEYYRNGPFESRDDALEDGREETLEANGTPTRIWTGRQEQVSYGIDVDQLVDQMLDSLCDQIPTDVIDDSWPDFKPEEKLEFQAELDALVKKHVPQPSFFKIEDVECHEPKEEPVDVE